MARYYANKSYKIYPFYSYIFDTCMSICKRDRLKDALLIEIFHKESLNDFPIMSNGEFFEFIISNKLNPPKSSTRSFDSRDHIEKLFSISKEYKVEWDFKERIVFNIRVHDSVHEKISTESKTVGTHALVIETAIINFINELDSENFKVFVYAFKEGLKDIIVL